MQTPLPAPDYQASHHRNRWPYRALAVLTLSLGIGATTAAFSVIETVVPHSNDYPSCSATMAYTADTIAIVNSGFEAPALRDRMTDAYESGMDAAGDGVASWVEGAGGAADVGVVLLLGALALALLVACANAARVLHQRGGHPLARPSAPRAALSTVGALSVAAVLLRAISSSSVSDTLGVMSTVRLDARAVAFAAGVFAIVEARRRILPRLT